MSASVADYRVSTDRQGAAVRSMTGYAQVRRQTSAGELTLSLRSVNHRGLDLHFYQGQEFGPFENELRGALKRGIARGHVEIRTSLMRAAENEGSGFNREGLKQYLAAFRQAADEFGVEGKPDLNRWLTLPGALNGKASPEALGPEFSVDLMAAAAECLAAFNETREREGQALRTEIETRVGEIEEATRAMLALREEALPQFGKRLREKLNELLGGSGLSEARLAEEAALLAERSDIQEELIRLGVHTAELRRVLDAGGEVGKRLDFLLQELNRETNTALSKSTNAGEPGLRITNAGLAIKANIERIREQGLNLE